MSDDKDYVGEESSDIGITFRAHFARFATQVDGAIRLSLDLSPHESIAVLKILGLKDRVFQVAMIAEPKKKEIHGPW